jgi:membrane associated rhomboid family serine protease
MICYRHPGREAYVRCQRCEQIICPECQIEASVGFLCPECAGGTPQQLHSRARRAQAIASGRARPTVSITLIALNVLVWVLQVLPGSNLTDQLVYSPLALYYEPWRAITSGFAHDQSNILHLALNMYSLYIFGQVLEPLIGRGRFLALYLISMIGGSAAITLLSGLNSATLGASGAIFGLMGAYFVIMRKLGAQGGQLLGLIAINFAFGFFMGGISWQAHLGGLIGGVLVALVLAGTRRANQKTQQMLGLIGVTVLLIAITYAAFFVRLSMAFG